MKKIGLALSGGGFRATLYHLGMIRFLRDAGILPQVTHITSVSGGSIMAAHLVLNWDRYNGSPSEYDAVAAEILNFVRMGARNRITRRFPLTLPFRWPRRLLGFSNRKLTRTGLLEYFYEKYLFGDTSLFQLPEKPELHILATNLSEGCLCSFSRNGLMMMRRQSDNSYRADLTHVGLATVPMAVTASSAFPGFFPPIELTGTDVGATGGEFGRQSYTDGGVFDNLGVRAFKHLNLPLDGVLVSDVGKRIQVKENRRAGGLIRTTLRATDILMDRVGQLETETFENAPGFVFATITDVVEPSEDATALHPEIQRQVAQIRTDLDAFSSLEISTLVRHGYCVGRKVCRANPELFGVDLPGNSPWDPIPPASLPSVPVTSTGSPKAASSAALQARKLQASAVRRIWSTVLDRRDWASYIYVPLLVPILVLMPYFIAKSYQRSHRQTQLMETLSQGSRDTEQINRLLDGPIKPWIGEPAEEVATLDEPHHEGFEIYQDSRIFDLRNWNPLKSEKENSGVYAYRRLKVYKLPDNNGKDPFSVHVLATSPKASLRFPAQQLQPKLSMASIETKVPGQKEYRWRASYDFQPVPAGDYVDLVVEYYSPGLYLKHSETTTTLSFPLLADTAEMTVWIFMPEGKNYKSYRIIRYETGKPERVEAVKIVNEYLAEDTSILAFKLLSLNTGYVYDIIWSHK